MAGQMAQGRHFPGDPPADQFPDSRITFSLLIYVVVIYG
jgi:hypothetical protein